MITSYKQLRFYLYADAKMSRLEERGFFGKYCHDRYRRKYLRCLRITEYFHNCRDKGLHFWMYFVEFFFSRRLDRLGAVCGFDIPLNVLGYGVNIAHCGSIVINSNCKIGNYCAIMNNVTIADSNPKIIGNGVLIGSNVVITKSVHLADGTKVAACSLLNQSVYVEKCLWGGVKAELLKENQEYWYLLDETVKTIYEDCEAYRKILKIR